MRITITRERYTTDGWEPMPRLVLDQPPAAAWEYASHRDDGPVAPTHEEIVDACIERYRRSSGGGTLLYGDIAVTRVQVASA